MEWSERRRSKEWEEQADEARRRNAHGLDPKVRDGAGDALPAAGVGVAGPPAGEPLHGGVEGQLELQQRLACNQPTKQETVDQHSARGQQ